MVYWLLQIDPQAVDGDHGDEPESMWHQQAIASGEEGRPVGAASGAASELSVMVGTAGHLVRCNYSMLWQDMPPAAQDSQPMAECANPLPLASKAAAEPKLPAAHVTTTDR